MFKISLEVLFGFILLITGGEFLVRGASRLALALGIPVMVISLTIVAAGTSAPEFTVAFQAALAGHMNVSLGDLIGSNMFNVFFILGSCSLIRPFENPFRKIKADLMWMLASTGFLILISLDLTVEPLEGVLLVAGAISYTLFKLFRGALKRSGKERGSGAESRPWSKERFEVRRLILNGVLIVAGISFLSFGAHFLIAGAVELAQRMRLSEFFIGVVLVAVGTSLPELATSLIAHSKGEGDIALGNIVGSNIYNLCLILGSVSCLSVKKIEVPRQVFEFDLPFMFISLLFWIIVMRFRGRLGRFAGGALVVVYGIYILLHL